MSSTPSQTPAPEVMLNVYKAHMPSVNYVFKDGTKAVFVSGVFRTSKQVEIAELNAEIAAGHPHIYIDPNETEVSSKLVDPLEALRAKIIAEHMASLDAAAGDPNRDMGTTTQGPLKVSSTRDIEEAAAGGSGTPLAARLVNLGKK